MPSERFVFDTNVLVSALLFAESTSAQAFFTALPRGTILTSQMLAFRRGSPQALAVGGSALLQRL